MYSSCKIKISGLLLRRQIVHQTAKDGEGHLLLVGLVLQKGRFLRVREKTALRHHRRDLRLVEQKEIVFGLLNLACVLRLQKGDKRLLNRLRQLWDSGLLGLKKICAPREEACSNLF